MKLLHLASGHLYGGIERFLVTLARLQSREQLEHHYLLTHEGRLAEELRGARAELDILEGARLRFPWRIRRTGLIVREKVRELKPDLVIAHGPWAYLVLGNLLDPEPATVLFEHGLVKRDLLHRLVTRHPPTAIVANSSLTASSASAIFARYGVHVCPCPVDLPPPTRSRADVRAELDAAEAPVIVVTSRFEPWKGHKMLLKALLKVPERWQLWLAGGQSRPIEVRLLRELENFARAHRLVDRVRFLGERRDISNLLHAADVFCQPNVGVEPFGIGLLEAMSAGLPVVATIPGATADPVEPHAGFRVPPEPEALASALSKLLSDHERRSSLGAAARARFASHHSTPVVLSGLARALERVLARGNEAKREWA